MEDIIVFGKGAYYLKRKQALLKSYRIIAFIDNSVEENDTTYHSFENAPLLHPSHVSDHMNCRIMIMSGHFISMWRQLLQYDIAAERMLFGCNLSPYEENDIFSPSTKLFADKNCLTLQVEGGEIYSIQDEKEYQRLHQSLLRKAFQNKDLFSRLPLTPVSAIFGLDRGTPVDRYYIENFLQSNSHYITGDVLEIAEDTYTYAFGTNINKSYIMHVEGGGQNIIKGDLSTGEGIVENMADCIICTQTLPFIFDLSKVAENMLKMLKPNGVLLITVSGITQISRYDMQRWGHYWSFTDASLKKLFLHLVPEKNISVETFGNVKAATAFLYGLAAEELEENDLKLQDADYQLIVTAVVRR